VFCTDSSSFQRESGSVAKQIEQVILGIVHALEASLSTLTLTISATNIYKKEESNYTSTILRS